MFEQNNVGVRLRNPVAAFIDSIESFEQADMFARELLSDVQLIAANLENEVCMDEACGEGDGEEEDEYEDIEDGDDENIQSMPEGTMNAADVIDESTGNPDLDIVHDTIAQYGEDSFLPPLDGTAFYLLICKINHSCLPNVVVKYTSSEDTPGQVGLVARLVALREILPGEELVQSYVDASLPAPARVKLLSEYGFKCACAKCVA
ncbi:SET domain-containing protein-lysine N-methyltransferase [archaeon]|nr:MAG: SET domain-containing protein-lysine N-methyltransferase [archaeon]